MNPMEEQVSRLTDIIGKLERTIALKNETIDSQNFAIQTLETTLEIYKKMHDTQIEERDMFLHAFESIFLSLTEEQKAQMPHVVRFQNMVHLVLYGNNEMIDKK